MRFIFFVSLSAQIFIKDLVKFQGIKTRSQALKDATLVRRAFSERDVSEIDQLWFLGLYDVFKYKDGNETVASVYIKRNTYYKKVNYLFFSRIEEVQAVEIYSLWVNEKYRCQGVARRLLYDALVSIRDEYNFCNDFVVGLHLNEEDKYMNISFAFYYALNFRKGTYVEYGPDGLQNDFERIYELQDPVSIVRGKAPCYDKGAYFAMYTTFNNLLFSNPINKSLIKLGEVLRKDLQARKKKQN